MVLLIRAVAQGLARAVRDGEVGGSNPLSPTDIKAVGSNAPAFFCGAPEGRTHLAVKVLSGLDRGTVSRTPRVSVVRRNLKKGEGKALVRRTGSA
jgi:hypothetical protein